MTLEEIIAEFRSQRTDAVAPYLWSDDEIISYLNSAMQEACERALLIEDSTTTDCSRVTLIAAQSSYALHASVLQVKRVTYAGQKIIEASVEALDDADPLWETRTGVPNQYVMIGKNTLRLVPVPTADSVAVTSQIELTVFRTPLVQFSDSSPDNMVPEIPFVYHLRLMPWLYRCALLKTDAETFNKEDAMRHEAIFVDNFGIRPDANVQRKRRDKRFPVTRMIW